VFVISEDPAKGGCAMQRSEPLQGPRQSGVRSSSFNFGLGISGESHLMSPLHWKPRVIRNAKIEI
jgi:hypothetical protein